jgi:hypothetical protein
MTTILRTLVLRLTLSRHLLVHSAYPAFTHPPSHVGLVVWILASFRVLFLSLLVCVRSTTHIVFPTFGSPTLLRFGINDLALRVPVFSGLYCYWVGPLPFVLVFLDSASLFSL